MATNARAARSDATELLTPSNSLGGNVMLNNLKIGQRRTRRRIVSSVGVLERIRRGSMVVDELLLGVTRAVELLEEGADVPPGVMEAADAAVLTGRRWVAVLSDMAIDAIAGWLLVAGCWLWSVPARARRRNEFR